MLWTTVFKQILLDVAAPLIIEAGKALIGQIGESSSMNKKSTINDVEKNNESIVELCNYIKEQSKPMVNQANEAVMKYIEEQISTLESKSELLAKYKISSNSIERKMYNMKQKLDLNKFWNEELDRRISIDNVKCVSILSLPSGAKKTNEINRFANDVMALVFDEYIEILRKELRCLYDDFEEDVARSVSQLEKTVNEYNEVVQSIDSKDDEKYEQLIAKAGLKIICYEAIMEKVGA